MTGIKRVAIGGISGSLAILIAEEILNQDANVLIRGSSRKPDTLPSWIKESSRVELVQIKDVFDPSSLDKLVANSDTVICAYFADNNTMEEGQTLLIDACERNKVSRYIASDWTVDYTKLDFGDNELKDPMKRVKTYLENSKPSVKGVHILVGVFLEVYWKFWAPWNPQENTLAYWGTGTERWQLMTYRTVAQYTAAVALDPNAVGVLKFVGNEKNVTEIAQDFEKVHGIRLTPKRLGSLNDLRETIKPAGQPQNLLASGEYYLLNGKSALQGSLSNDLFPSVTPETVASFFHSRSISELEPAPMPSQTDLKDS